MISIENSVFYKKAKKMLDEFVANGGNVNDLTKADLVYRYIKDNKSLDEFGNRLDVEAKFNLLGYPRKRKQTNTLREDLINDINEFLKNGGSLHIPRKQFPFYERVRSYIKYLSRHGIEMTFEEVIKNDLGFKAYSEDYYRCLGIEKLKNYRDDEGYVDDYKKDCEYNNFIKALAETYEVPYYFIITILADEKTRKYYINVDKIEYTKRILQKHAEEYQTFVGIKRNFPKVYNALDYLTRYFSDGVEKLFSKKEWLDAFGLGDVENKFKPLKEYEDTDFDKLMLKLKQKYGDREFLCKDLSDADYRRVIKKAVSMNIQVYEIFKTYGLNVKGNNIERLASVKVDEIPFIEEMKEKRDEIISEMIKPNMCKEEIFETKIYAMKIVYEEFREKLLNYMPYENINEVTI